MSKEEITLAVEELPDYSARDCDVICSGEVSISLRGILREDFVMEYDNRYFVFTAEGLANAIIAMAGTGSTDQHVYKRVKIRRQAE